MASRSEYMRDFQIKFRNSFENLLIYYNGLGYWPSLFFTAFLILIFCGLLSTLMRIVSFCFIKCGQLLCCCSRKKRERRNSQEFMSTTNPLLRSNANAQERSTQPSPVKKEPMKYVVETVLMLPDYRRQSIDSRSPLSQPNSSSSNTHRPYDITSNNEYDHQPSQCGHYSDPVCSVTQAYVVVPNSGVKYDYDPLTQPFHNTDMSPTSPVSPVSPTNPNYRREKFYQV